MSEQKLVTFKINDRELQVPAGTLVIEGAKQIATEVPSFCYYPGLSLQAACRMCLVEVEKMPKMQTACTLVATDGMVVRTDTPQIKQARKGVLEFLLTNHPLDCPVCDKGGECELQDMVFRYGADSSRFVEEKIHRPEEKWSEIVYYDAPRCILCFRCVRVCDEGMDVKALGVGMRGANSVIIPNGGDHLECEECGMCIDICPVGALTSGTYRYKTRPWEMEYVPTVCAHCSNGCKTTLSVRNHEIIRAINGDFLCIKGRFGFDFTKHPDRIKQPMVRKGDKLFPVSWEEAAQAAASKLKSIHARDGGDSIGFIGSNRTSNEENYLFQKLARETFGTANIDHHRSEDYTGLVTALGDNAKDSLLTMDQLYKSKEIKLERKAEQFVQIAEGQEAAAIRLLHSEIPLGPALVEQLTLLKAELDAASDVAIVFGSELSGSAIADLVGFGSKLHGKVRYMALGDYENSRGAADMGVLPDRGPGYAKTPRNGMTTPQMIEAAQNGKLKALYVVGGNT